MRAPADINRKEVNHKYMHTNIRLSFLTFCEKFIDPPLLIEGCKSGYEQELSFDFKGGEIFIELL